MTAGGIYFVKRGNQQVDRDVDAVCQRYNQNWSERHGNQITVAFRSQYTGICIPKHVMSMRWIHIGNLRLGAGIGVSPSEPGAMPAAHMPAASNLASMNVALGPATGTLQQQQQQLSTYPNAEPVVYGRVV